VAQVSLKLAVKSEEVVNDENSENKNSNITYSSRQTVGLQQEIPRQKGL